MTKQKNFLAEEIRLEALEKEGDPLILLNQTINWNIFKTILTNAFKKEKKSNAGRPAYDHIMMFKILILQRLYNLSDDRMQFHIMDRLSFMRFLNLGLEDKVPDAKTIWHFREVLIQKDKIKILFNKFTKELKSQRLIANEGAIIDASFVEVPIQRNSKKENDKIKNGETPADWDENKKRQKDVDARWMTKNNQRHYGYKDHIKIDRKSKFITNYEVTSANIHDSQALEDLIDNTDKHHDLFADSAYSGQPIKDFLKKKKIRNRIHEKGYRGKPLTEEQKEKNKSKSKIRARVEHVFGCIGNSMNGLQIRTIGKKRAEAIIGLNNLAYNFLRLGQI